jgi:hypothetical protein
VVVEEWAQWVSALERALAAEHTAAAAVVTRLHTQVQGVVLVESVGAPVSHAGVASAVVSSWGGGATFTVLHVERQ